eukprot:scaffold1821_cov84-Cylindrotheca_fusiformis.AAC.1
MYLLHVRVIRPIVDLGTSWKPPRSHRLLLSCKPYSTPVDTRTSQQPQPSSAVPQTCDGQTVPYRICMHTAGCPMTRARVLTIHRYN